MLETKEQKQIFAGSIVLIIILSVVSFWGRPGLRHTDAVAYSDKNQSVKDARAYLEYLKTIKTDPVASKELFQTILTQEDVRKEVATALEADKQIKTPPIETGKIKKSLVNDDSSVSIYLNQ